MVTYRVTARSSGVLIMSLSAHLDFQREGQPRLQSALSRDSNVSLYTQKSARSGNGPRHSRWSCDVFRCPCPSRSWMTAYSESASAVPAQFELRTDHRPAFLDEFFQPILGCCLIRVDCYGQTD